MPDRRYDRGYDDPRWQEERRRFAGGPFRGEDRRPPPERYGYRDEGNYGRGYPGGEGRGHDRGRYASNYDEGFGYGYRHRRSIGQAGYGDDYRGEYDSDDRYRDRDRGYVGRSDAGWQRR
jgi:hypothetical protein